MSDFDVLIIGGYTLEDVSSGSSATRSKMRLSHKNHLVTLDFIKHMVHNKGDIETSEKLYWEKNKTKLLSRSLNTIYLYDYLTKNGVKTEVVSYFLLERDRFNNLMSKKPKVVVISTTFTSFVKDINEIAIAAKEISPDSLIIAGGIKVLKSNKIYSLSKQNYFDDKVDDIIIGGNNFFFGYDKDKFIDVFVIEECGEITLLEIIRKALKGESYKSIPNIAFYENNQLVFTEKIREPYTFDTHQISWDKIPREILGIEIPIRAGMGCPFRCGFCDFAGLHKVKVRTIDSLINELKLVNDVFPNRPIFFTDDNLFVTKNRTKEFAEAIVKNGIKVKWWAFFRVDAISEDNVEVLAKSGCYMCFLGVESGDESVLKNMNKKASRKQILDAIKLLNGNGINTLSSFVIGFPGETRDSINNTISLLNSYPEGERTINYYYPFVFIYSALAPVCSPSSRKKYGLVGGADNWKHSTMNSDDAKEQLLRLFKEVNVPILPYPEETMDPSIDLNKFKEVLRARQNLVKNGVNVLDDSNVSQIYEVFHKIICQ